jgi:two-component system cell cycle response regulator
VSRSKRTEESGIKDSDTKTEIQTSLDDLARDAFDKAQKWNPSFVVIQGDLIGRVFKLKDEKTLIGRHPSCQIPIQHRAVSSQHAAVKRLKNTIVVEDLKSTNGTFVNQAKITVPVTLKTGDLVRMGGTVLKYVDSELDVDFSESLHNQMTRDALTGVFNRGYVIKALSSLMDIAKTGSSLSMILIDLDHFKKVNDTLGHLAGDQVLRDTCKVLVESVFRGEDVVGRYGGEEFIALLPDCALKTAIDVAERARKTIESHRYFFEGSRIAVTASFGVGHWEPKFSTPEEFISIVDAKLYEAKKSGRNRVVS